MFFDPTECGPLGYCENESKTINISVWALDTPLGHDWDVVNVLNHELAHALVSNKGPMFCHDARWARTAKRLGVSQDNIDYHTKGQRKELAKLRRQIEKVK